MQIVSLSHKESGSAWRLWPECEISRAYTRNLGSFSLTGDPIKHVEYFRHKGYPVQVRTNSLVLKYEPYKKDGSINPID